MLVAGADCAEKNELVVGVAAVVDGVPNEKVDVLPLGCVVAEGENSDEVAPVLVPVPNVNAILCVVWCYDCALMFAAGRVTK